MEKKDFNNYRNSVIEGCIENIFDEDYIYYFLKINEMNFIDEDSIKYFKYKNYSNSGMFKILFSNSLRKKYLGKINNELLNIITNLAKSDNKIDVSTMMAYTCFENIDNTVEISEFENKFNVLKYFVKKNLQKNEFNISIDNYAILKKYSNIFCMKDNHKYFKPISEIDTIISEMNNFISIEENTFEEACELYSCLSFNKIYKKM